LAAAFFFAFTVFTGADALVEVFLPREALVAVAFLADPLRPPNTASQPSAYVLVLPTRITDMIDLLKETRFRSSS
jgi:hypothetical protein